MHRTTMPEATVHEHRHLAGAEHEVGRPAELGERLTAYPIAKATPMHL